MITLDATLKAAQDGLTHKPICKIVSTSLAADIPFDGQLFSSQTSDETNPDMTAHSSGRLVSTFVRDGDLYLMYSDATRTTWTEVLVFNNSGISGFSVMDASIVELSTGNLGIVFLARSSTYDRLYSMIIGPTGTVVSAASQIVQQTLSSVTLGAMSLCETASGFILAYKYINTAADPDDYYIYRRTCNSSFASWSDGSAITLTGLISSRDKNHPELFRNQDGAIYLFFDYVDDIVDTNERRNIFYMISADEGANWTSPEALTSYGDFSASAVSPSVGEKTNGDIVVAYNAEISVLKITKDSTGYCTSSGDSDLNYVTDLFYIPSSGKLYVVSTWTYTGTKKLLRVLVIDVATWSIEKCYKQDGSPGWNAWWSVEADLGWTQNFHAAGDFIAISSPDWGMGGIILINTQSDTIVEYHFSDKPEYGITKNLDGITIHPYYDERMKVFLDVATSRLYIVIYGTWGTNSRYCLYYIDITQTADPITGKYDVVTVIPGTVYNNNAVSTDENVTIHFNVAEDKFVFSLQSVDYPQYTATLIVHVLSTGSLYKSYLNSTNAGFPHQGVAWPVIIDNVIYANTPYLATYGQQDRRGLCIIDMTSDTVTYEQPTYSTLDNYSLQDLEAINSGEDIIMGSPSGVIFYSVRLRTWTRYHRGNVPGLYSDDSDESYRVAYDEAGEMVFTSHCFSMTIRTDQSITAFVTGGSIFWGKYIQGVLSGESYNFGSEANLHLKTGGHDLVVAYDEDDILWNIWSNQAATGEISLMWDRDNFNPDVSDYILAGNQVAVEWEIGKIARTSFALARADLFDPSNSMSILSPVFKKGRIAEISFGETVAGVDYWQYQGKFVVVSSQIDYSRTRHPVIRIEAEDRSSMWPEMMVTTTTGFRNSSLSDVLDDLLQTIAGLGESEYTVPELSNDHTLYTQWVDTDLATIIEEICHHFGVFPHWEAGGTWTLKPIDLTAAAAHDYTAAQSKIIKFSPDDRYSTFINEITVKCEGQDFLEVLWDEERITQMSGVVGFWSKEETHKAYYSDDRARTVRYPRLDVIQSIKDFSPLVMLLGGTADEYIESMDVNETYCIVKIEAPNRAVYAFAFAAMIAGFGATAIYCEYRLWCGVAIMMTNLALSSFIQVVTAVANFKYDIWGQPIGHEKQTYQATASDTDFQQLLGGTVVNQQIEDPLSYTVSHCQMVADHELAVVSAQRNRITFEKVAHLQDEIGDIVKINHPISSQALSIFVAKIKRIFNRPAVGGQGQFTDSIEGWKL